jgi:16S rRNA (cytidine1402-2'-O)-methyltransferase
VVATPIGNREDITLRAIGTLNSVDIIAAEDTRITGMLLKEHGIRTRLVSYHEHNEDERTPELMGKIRSGLSVALVSDAGTPTVSDPGYRLIEQALAAGLTVVPVPGVSAAVAALSVSGLPTDAFVFVGFLPRKKNKRSLLLQELADNRRTLIFFESPQRILALIDEIIGELGDRSGMLAREMTKPHEEYLRGKLSDIRQALGQKPSLRGEFTLLVSGIPKAKDSFPDEALAELTDGLKRSDVPLSTLSKAVSRKYKLPKNVVYAAALKLRQSRRQD